MPTAIRAKKEVLFTKSGFCTDCSFYGRSDFRSADRSGHGSRLPLVSASVHLPVNFHVYLELMASHARFAGEVLAAFVADERAFSGVTSYVKLQPSCTRKRLPAQAA